jgi:hypothetical protein
MATSPVAIPATPAGWSRSFHSALASGQIMYLQQLAESHLTRRLFGQILRRIERLTWRPT